MGIESDKREVDFAKGKGINVINAFLDFNDEGFAKYFKNLDVVSMFNVLEHIEDPMRVVEWLYRVMKSGSVLIIEAPRHPSVASFANMTAGDHIYRHLQAPDHVSVFTEKSMEILLARKFEIVGKWGFGQGYVDIINNAMLISGISENALYFKLLENSDNVQRQFDEAGLSDTMIYVAIRI